MSTDSKTRVVTTYRLREMKSRGEKISMLTAYDYSMARIVDAAGVDVVLVGDSAANVMAGFETTVPMTLDHMIYHARSVTRAVKRALVVVDMPFAPIRQLARSARVGRPYHEGGRGRCRQARREARRSSSSVQRILCAGIPVMGHLGLTPQSIHKYGTYAVRAKEQAEADKLVRDAHLLEEAGCFGLVLEKIPAVLGTRVSQELEIPTIGIGAGGGTDGQVLVIHDMLGINNEFSPRFLRRYADLYTQMMTGVSRYVEDVKSGDFPSEQEQY